PLRTRRSPALPPRPRQARNTHPHPTGPPASTGTRPGGRTHPHPTGPPAPKNTTRPVGRVVREDLSPGIYEVNDVFCHGPSSPGVPGESPNLVTRASTPSSCSLPASPLSSAAFSSAVSLYPASAASGLLASCLRNASSVLARSMTLVSISD